MQPCSPHADEGTQLAPHNLLHSHSADQRLLFPV